MLAAIDRDLADEDAGAVAASAFLIIDKLEILGVGLYVVGAFERFPDVRSSKFATEFVGEVLDVL